MAMTKKEQAAMHEAIYKAELLAALRWTAPVEKDIRPPPTSSDGHSEGWIFNSYSQVVERGWSTSVSHGSGNYDSRRSGSQRPQWMFSSKEKALAAMRHELEKMAAGKLLDCDKRIRDAANES